MIAASQLRPVVRVLVVDDDPDDVLLIGGYLEDPQRTVSLSHAADATGCLERLSTAEPDVLLIDYRLGAEDGLGLLRRIRAAGFTTPVVMLTGCGDERIAVESIKAGATDYLAKARLTGEALWAAIRHAIEIHSSDRLRRVAETALRESEARYRRVFDQALIGNYIAAVSGRILACNKAFAELLGFASVADALEASAFTLYPDPSQRERMLARLIEHGSIEALEAELRRADGQRVHVIENVLGIFDDRGRLVEIQGSILDVTDRRRTEQELLLRERAIEGISQGVLIADARDRALPVIYANPAFERITGYSREEVLGRNCRFLQGPDSDPEARRALREALADGRPVSVEILNYRKDGTPFWNAVSITPIHDAAGQLTHFVGLQTDVTEKRRIEETLRQSQKLEALGQLAGGVAHDFNNLLGVILGYADLAARGLGPSHPQTARVTEIQRAAHRAAGLTRQLLAFSRKQVVQPRTLDLNAVVRGVAPMLERLIRENVHVELELAEPLPSLLADPGQLEQILINLTVNARDAMPEGGTVTLSTSAFVRENGTRCPCGRLARGRYVRLTVTDTGLGMPQHVLDRLFEPFFTTKAEGKGTGLGLAGVHGIVQQNGGHIDVESEPGRGTRFSIFLPAAAAEAARPAGAAAPAAPARPLAVLLVEDDPPLRRVTEEALAAAGHTVLCAATPSEALERSRGQRGAIDLLISDVVLRTGSGRDVAWLLRAQRPGLPVLFVSGHDEPVPTDDADHSRAAFLQKPFSNDELLARIAELVGPGPARTDEGRQA